VTVFSVIAATSVDFHSSFSRVVLIYSAIIGLWGLFLYFRGSNPSPGYLGALVIAEGVGLFQGAIGLFVRSQGHAPHDALHYLYGVVLVITLPAAYFLGKGASERRDSLIFGLAGLFMLGIAIRGVTTGAG
jgi:heme A synthase